MRTRDKIKSYFWNILVWGTQSLNVVTGGDPDQTFSGRTGIMFLLGKRWAKTIMPVIDWIFNKITGEEDHCINSIEWDRVKEENLVKIRGVQSGKYDSK
jgi:hypothetical protein